MSSTQQAIQEFNEVMQTFLYNFKVMEQSFDMLQMAAKELEDQLTPSSHPVTRQPAIHRTDQLPDQLHEQPKVGRPLKYTSEEERREAQRRSAKKSYEKRKAKLQALEEEVQRLKNELDQEPK